MPIYHPTEAGLVNREYMLATLQQSGAEAEADFRATAPNEAVLDDAALAEVSFATVPVPASPLVRGFVEVGIGKPLSIVLRQVYTGQFPQKHLFSSTKPMLLTTAIKDISTTSAAVRAVNIVKDKVSPHSSMAGPAATAEGTNLIYYSPAVVSPLINITVEMIFQDFDPQIFSRASQLFQNLGGVPIFMPASGYLMGASTVLKLAGNVGQALFDGQPVLSETMQLDFSFGGGSIPVPGFWVFSESPLDLKSFLFDPTQGLLDRDGKPYSGDEPFVVLSIDGTKVESLANFSPLLASASVLGKFYNQKDGSEVLSDTILDSVKLFNDLSYRKKADALKQKLSALTEGSADFASVKGQLDAFIANIEEPLLKPQ